MEIPGGLETPLFGEVFWRIPRPTDAQITIFIAFWGSWADGVAARGGSNAGPELAIFPTRFRGNAIILVFSEPRLREVAFYPLPESAKKDPSEITPNS